MTKTEVTQEEFYKVIGKLDVVIQAVGNFPYTVSFKLRNGILKGECVDSFLNGNRSKLVSTYFIVEN